MSESDQQSQVSNSSAVPGTGKFERLNEQVQFGHKAWIERLQEMQAVETAYTKELLATRDPNEALKICNRWIAKRLELLAADSKAFTGFWMDLVMTAAGGAQSPSGPKVRDK